MKLDHTTIRPGGPPPTAKSGTPDYRWWLKKSKEAAEAVTAVLDVLKKNSEIRSTQHLISSRLYGNLPMMGINGLTFSKVAAATPALKDRISYNVVSAVVDTITAKIAKNKPKPLFLTNGGDYKLQRRAKKLNKFIDGVFYENDAYRLGVEAFRFGAVWGTGPIHVYACHGRVKFEVVMPSELYVDELEGFYGEPRSLHRCKSVDRQVLADKFPKHRALILKANVTGTEGEKANHTSDMVTVRESWHLPSGPDATDGRHVISIEEGVLFEEEWDKDFFPFAFFHWNKRLYGFWGQGAAERLQNIQLEINKLLWVIQRSMHLAGSFKILIENTSRVVSEHLNNDIGSIVKYTGTPPQYVVPPTVPAEYFSHFMELRRSAFEQEGVSMLSATSKKPDGLNSGAALREYNDIESDRFHTIGKAFENLFIDLGKLAIATIKDIVETEGEDYEVKAPNNRFVQSIKWSDVELDEDQYVMQCFPVSSLPNEPSARRQTVQEYVQAGWLTPRQGRKLMDFPDIEHQGGLATAAEEWIEYCMDKIVDEGVMIPPEPYDDMKLAHEMVLWHYQQGKTQGLEEEKLELLRTYMSQVETLAGMMVSPMAPAVGATPQALPAPSPTSDLIANVPGMTGGAMMGPEGGMIQ